MNTVTLKIKRQDDPSDLPYWEEFEVEAKDGMTVLAALNVIGENPVTADGNQTRPIVCESFCLEGLCGACSMIINGRAALACSMLVAKMDSPIKIEPMEKFPVLKDLKVDRARMFDAIARITHPSENDCAHEGDPALRISPVEQQRYSIFAECIMCGACAEGCPQAGGRNEFAGAFIFARAILQNSHPIGKFEESKRLREIAGRGGLSDCSGARVCESLCPIGIPLSEAIARLEWSATANEVRRFLRGD